MRHNTIVVKAVLILILVAMTVTVASSQITATLFVQPRPSPYPGEWQTNASIALLTVINTSGSTKSVQIAMKLTNRATGTVIVSGTSDVKTLTATPSQTILNNTQFLNLQNVTYDQSVKDQAIRTGRLPEGEYIACVDIKDVNGTVYASNVCSSPFTIAYPDAPRLISPVDGDSVTLQFPVFTWSPVAASPSYSVHYVMKMVELLPSQVPAQAINTNTPPQYENDNLTSTNLVYPTNGLPLVVGKNYVWSVQALDQNGNPAATNNGLSQIFQFNYKGVAPPPTPPPSVASCFTIANSTPADNGKIVQGNTIQFFVTLSQAINFSAVQSGTLKIWSKRDSSETASSATSRSPVLNLGISDPSRYLLYSETGTSTATIQVKLDTGSSPFAFHPETDTWYLWKLDLTVNGNTVRKDSVACTSTNVSSAYTSFLYQARPLSEETGQCKDNCSATPPVDQLPASFTFNVGDTIQVGKFRLTLTDVSGTAGNLNGKGTIKIPMFRAQMVVQFTGIKVNSSRQMYDGTITASQDAGSPLSSDEANSLNTALNLSQDKISAVATVASQAARLVKGFTGQSPMSLPIGLDNDIAGQRYVIGIIGMTWTPTKATLNAVVSYPLPDLGNGIAAGLGARNICFTPGGFGGDGNVTLYLPNDLGYQKNDTWGFRFLASTSSDSGCYVAFDCHGFKDFRISAQVEFPRTWLRPFPTDDGVSKVKASFTAHLSHGGNFIAAANMDKAEISSAPGFVMEVQELTFDKSSEENPSGIVFPKGYTGVTDNTWTGFYIKRASISLPPQLRTFNQSSPPQISVNNLLINRNGVTGSFHAENVFQYPNGNFGEWGGSLDTIAVDVVSSSLTRGWLTGKIKLPISETPLAYTATLARPSDTSKVLRYAFVVTPSDTFNADIWKAKIKLDPTSNITITNDNPQRKMVASATLNGSISIAGKIGPIPDLNLPGIGFQNMKLQTVKPYFTKGTFSFASPQKGMAGFPLSISNIDMVSKTQGSSDLTGVKFTVALNLSSGSSGVSGGTTLTLWGQIDPNSTGQKFKFYGIDMDSIAINADLAAVSVKGSLVLYHDDATFGSGFRGAISATILQRITLSSSLQFGQVNGYRYFYVDAKGIFSPGIAFGTTGVGFYGLGGGFWYNMKRTDSGNPPTPTSSGVAGSSPGATASGLQFVPNQGTIGFKAMVVLGTYPSSVAFNADVALEIQFTQTSTGYSMGTISLIGNGYMMAEVTNRSAAKVTCSANITYDFPNKKLHGTFNFNINASPVSGSGQMVVHVEQNTWYIKIGEPSNRVTLSLASFLPSVSAYLMVGQGLPGPPDPPQQVLSIIGRPSSTRNSSIASGSGFAFGASISFNTGRQTYSIFYGTISGGGGFDIAVLKQNHCTGINGWYAQGQLYAWIDASCGLYVDIGFWVYRPCGPWYCCICDWCRDHYVGYNGEFEVLHVTAAALLQAGGPNPLWVKGTVAGSYSILGGLVKGYCSFDFSKGDVCTL